ncbi:HMG-box [Auricularia subglabra TFB-10046 SS5]|nr:HMG-box [Auricularia subglabra TFB-10046 SS5]
MAPPPTDQDPSSVLDNQRYHLIQQAKEMARVLRDNASQCEQFADQLTRFSFGGLHAMPASVASWVNMSGMIPTPVELNGAFGGASSPVDDSGKKRKRRRGDKEKKVRDPDLPKRPPSAYLLYQNEVRKDMQEKFKHLPYKEVLGEIAKSWGAMSDADKKMYVDATAAAKTQYTDAKAQYDRSHGIPEKPRKAPGPNAAAAAPAAPTPAADSPEADEEESSEDKSESSSDDSSDEEEAAPEPPKKKAKDDKADSKKKSAGKDKKRKD